MDKVMDKVRRDHTFTFMKHLPIYDPILGPKFLKLIQVQYNMNSSLEMFIKKLQMLASV
jgi:hypothetical protein